MIRGIGDFYMFSWGVLWQEKFEIEMGIDAMKMLIVNQEKTWEEVRSKFDEYIENDSFFNSLEEEHQGSYYSQFFQMEEQTIDELKRYQRNAVCMFVFSFFEGKLKTICEKIEESNHFKIKIQDLAGNDHILKYWNYLIKIYEIDEEKVEPYLTPIKQQKIVRNIIAHQEGYLNEAQNKKLKLIAGLTVNDYGNIYQIEIDSIDFLMNLIDKINEFYKALLLAIDKRYKELNLEVA